MSDRDDVIDLVRARYDAFPARRRPDWRIEVGVGAARATAPADVRVSADGAPGRFSVERYDFAATIDLVARAARVTFDDVDELSLDSFLRVACSLALTDCGGLVLHAASLVRRERAHVFCGPSGTGKTTIARLSTDALVLTDELSIVRTTGDGGVGYGTPFWGELGRGGRDCAAPLAALYFPRQAARHALRRLTRTQALARLLPNVLFFARDAELTARVLHIAATLVQGVPCFELAFRCDAGFWEVIDHG